MTSADTRPRGADLKRLIEQADELQFIEHRDSGTVHVIVPNEPLWARTDTRALRVLPDEVIADSMLNLMMGATLTLCGWVAREHRGGMGEGDQPIKCFPDDRLCSKCRRVLGDQSHRAFEHPQPDDQIGAERV
jgi:hypothetical protein